MTDTNILTIGLDAPSGQQQTMDSPSLEQTVAAIQRLDGTTVSDLMLKIDNSLRYMTVKCNAARLCICSIQNGETVYMLTNRHPISGDNPFPDYPIEYCVPLDLAVQACMAYIQHGKPSEELAWDEL